MKNVLFHFADEYMKSKEFLRVGKDLYFADNLLGCHRDYLILPTDSDFANCVHGVVISEKNGPMVLTCRALIKIFHCIQKKMIMLIFLPFH